MNAFNNFLTNVGSDLADTLAYVVGVSIYDFLCPSNIHRIFVRSTDEEEILDMAHFLPNKTSNDCNYNCMLIVKNVIMKPITYICSKSIRSGIFPEGMKIGRVIPIFKSGEKTIFSNYWPVSILPQLSKILEKLFDIKLWDFITKHQILNESQYVFFNS